MRFCILILTFVVFSSNGFCQIVPGEKIKFSSPQATQITKFGGYKVNHSNGTPDVSIPLYALREGDIELPVSLVYNYNGFKPANEAAWVGLGWSLFAGGVVSRSVKGVADEFVGFGFQAHPNSVKNFVDLGSPTFSSYQTNIENNTDIQQDIYSFQFQGASGKFVLDESGSARVVSDKKIKIQYEKAADSYHLGIQVISKWIFTLEDGTKYTFSNQEFTVGGGPDNNYVPSAWFLSEIVDVRGSKITLEYTAPVQTDAGRRVQYGRNDQNLVVVIPGQVNSGTSGSNISQSKTEEIFLTKIKGSTWEVNFNSDTYSRLGNGATTITARKLNNIQFFDTASGSSVLRKQYLFTYSTETSSRLHLLEVGESGANPHKFEYNTLAPSYIDGSTSMVDYWGFYNGESKQLLIPINGGDLEPRLSQTIIGSLSKITYPTKGYTTFEYEQNSYSYFQTSQVTGTVEVVENRSHYWTWSNQSSSVLQGSMQNVVLTGPTRVAVQIINSSVTPAPTSCTDQGVFISKILSQGTYTPQSLLAQYNFYPCNQSEALSMQGVNITMNVKIFTPTTSNQALYGGIRIKRMVDYSAALVVASDNSYTYADDANSQLSSGVLASEALYNYVLTASWGHTYVITRSTPFNPEAMSPLYYKSVKVNNGLYETTHTFTSHVHQADIQGKWSFLRDSEYGFSSTSGNLSIGQIQTYDFMRCLPLQVTTKDLSGNTKQTISYNYSGFNTETFAIAALHYEPLGTYPITGTNGSPLNPTLYYGKAYYLVGGWPKKTSETVTTYGSNSADPVIVTTNYEYGASHLQLKKQQVTQSNGLIKETSYTYPLDYSTATGNTVIQAMIAANMVSYPIEQVTKLGTKEVEASLTTYNSFPGNVNKGTLYLPYKKFKFNGYNNSVPTNFGYYNGNSNETVSTAGNTNSYYEVAKYVAYNKYGNPISLLLNNSDKISYVWAYKAQHPVAEIQNADNAQVLGALGGTSFDAMADETNSATILSKISGLRAGLTNSLVTGYLYQPLVGMTQKIAPNGLSTYYTYDALERLEKIKDNNNQTVKSYKYNYATP